MKNLNEKKYVYRCKDQEQEQAIYERKENGS